VLINSYSKDEAAKWLVYLRIQASVNLLNLTIFLILLFVYVHSMTCITMILAWSWLSGDGEGSTVELRRWLDIDDTDSADTTNFVFFYFHCSLWVWSNVSGWGGNWSPHTPITSGWTYANQLLGKILRLSNHRSPSRDAPRFAPTETVLPLKRAPYLMTDGDSCRCFPLHVSVWRDREYFAFIRPGVG
jgi:hypothetical protein